MSLLVDTSVWSLAFRRDGQKVLQGFAGPNNRDQLVERLSVLAFLQPDKQDHIAAVGLRATPFRPGRSGADRC